MLRSISPTWPYSSEAAKAHTSHSLLAGTRQLVCRAKRDLMRAEDEYCAPLQHLRLTLSRMKSRDMEFGQHMGIMSLDHEERVFNEYPGHKVAHLCVGVSRTVYIVAPFPCGSCVSSLEAADSLLSAFTVCVLLTEQLRVALSSCLALSLLWRVYGCHTTALRLWDHKISPLLRACSQRSAWEQHFCSPRPEQGAGSCLGGPFFCQRCMGLLNAGRLAPHTPCGHSSHLCCSGTRRGTQLAHPRSLTGRLCKAC